MNCKKIIKLIVLGIVSSVIFIACSTDNPVQQTTKSKSELIIGKWLTDYFILNSEIIPKNKIATYSIEFSSSTYTEIDRNSSTLSTGKWSIKDDIIALKAFNKRDSASFRIQELDSIKLELLFISSDSTALREYFVRAK